MSALSPAGGVVDQAAAMICANPTCDRQARTNPHDFKGKYCTAACQRTARSGGYRHLSDVAIPMALYHKIIEEATEDAMYVDEWIVGVLHDAVS